MKTLDVIIDNNRACRFNLYPFAGPYHCTRLIVTLPDGTDVSVQSLNRYNNYGAISKKEISNWIMENGYGRVAGEPISQFSFTFEEKNGTHHYTVVEFLGTRMPRR